MYIIALEIKIKINFLNKITISKKYSDYADIFLSKFIIKFLKYSNNNNIIKLKVSK